jgi:hypothetical protein
MSASKAELHAVMATLTYKDRVSVTKDSLGDSIQKIIFQGNKQQHGGGQSSEIKAFLSNPYESIAVLCE